MAEERPPLLYALHSGNLYGTERMALATVARLVDDFDPVIAAPPGAALAAAADLGFATAPFDSSRELAAVIWRFLGRGRRLVFVATGVSHSLLFVALNGVRRRRAAHLHLVHGGTDERLSYGRKKVLNHFDIQQVAVSAFVHERLVAHGVTPGRISVIENFLDDAHGAAIPRRKAGAGGGIQRVCIVSRVDPIKRLDLVFDAVDAVPELGRIRFDVYGEGWDFDAFRQRAQQGYPNIRFHGFRADAVNALAESDLLLHLCPVEPFGLAILEAMTAGVPVLVPDAGGAGSLVEDGVSGFRFTANDPLALARRLQQVAAMPAASIEAVVSSARVLLATRFDPGARAADYRRLIVEALG